MTTTRPPLFNVVQTTRFSTARIRKSSSGTSVSVMIRQPSSFLSDGVIWEASPAQASSSLTGSFFLFISASFNSKVFVRHSLSLQGWHKDTEFIPTDQENNVTTMSLSNVFALAAVIQFPDGLYRAEIRCFREKFNQAIFRTINQPFRHHFHEMHHDVVSSAITGIKVNLPALCRTIARKIVW